ncbi:TetR/AcrR family transcriptional regulator [Streptomyces sp. NPDC058685]|uniref:TetR/AcrR family transcriptional regulator n=1 Tax=Streptomyces sp. NPDC058685 TaxID=3346598 RepID=UPI0036550309
MTTTATASTRDRLLDAAAELFYLQGVNIGVEALCKAAGVSKRSMYQLFDSKDAVLAASLERRAPAYATALFPAADDTRPPRDRILHVFERLEAQALTDGFRGCPFLAAQVELKDPEHPASKVAREVKQTLTEYFRLEAQHGEARDPALLARQLTLLFDGASARAGVGAEQLDGLTLTTARVLMDASGMTK